MQIIGKKYYIVTAIIVLTTVIFLFAWYIVFLLQLTRPNQVVAPQVPSATTRQAKPAPTTNNSLGVQIFQKAQNPLQKKLPDTNPVKNANPIQGAYTNPF